MICFTKPLFFKNFQNFKYFKNNVGPNNKITIMISTTPFRAEKSNVPPPIPTHFRLENNNVILTEPILDFRFLTDKCDIVKTRAFKQTFQYLKGVAFVEFVVRQMLVDEMVVLEFQRRDGDVVLFHRIFREFIDTIPDNHIIGTFIYKDGKRVHVSYRKHKPIENGPFPSPIRTQGFERLLTTDLCNTIHVLSECTHLDCMASIFQNIGSILLSNPSLQIQDEEAHLLIASIQKALTSTHEFRPLLRYACIVLKCISLTSMDISLLKPFISMMLDKPALEPNVRSNLKLALRNIH
jgi:hypothetical protein